METIIFYTDDGEIKFSSMASSTIIEKLISENRNLNHLIVDSVHDLQNYYVNNGELVKKPDQPLYSSTFDYKLKEWIIDPLIAELSIKIQRNRLLADSDWTDTVSAQSRLSNYDEWQSYRQQLRDITLQDGYPMNVIWPHIPE